MDSFYSLSHEEIFDAINNEFIDRKDTAAQIKSTLQAQPRNVSARNISRSLSRIFSVITLIADDLCIDTSNDEFAITDAFRALTLSEIAQVLYNRIAEQKSLLAEIEEERATDSRSTAFRNRRNEINDIISAIERIFDNMGVDCDEFCEVMSAEY